MQIQSFWLDQISFSDGLKAQEQACLKLTENSPACLLGLEHRPVVTLGKRADINQDVPSGEALLLSRGFELVRIDRGGQATMHTPGQLVIYPICDLRRLGFGVREFVDLLLRTSQETLKDFGIDSWLMQEGTGLETTQGKIAFVGLRIRQGISFHGLAINVNNQLSDFDWIRSCGKSKAQHASCSSHGVDASSLKIFQLWTDKFKLAFA